MKNPIIDELKRLKLISKLNLSTISNKTRDKNIKVIKDLKTKIIFLEKYITSTKYYSSLKHKDHDRKDKNLKKKLLMLKLYPEKLELQLLKMIIEEQINLKNILKTKIY